MSELNFANARIVLGDEVIRGSVSVRDGRIAAIDHGLKIFNGERSAVGEAQLQRACFGEG